MPTAPWNPAEHEDTRSIPACRHCASLSALVHRDGAFECREPEPCATRAAIFAEPVRSLQEWLR